MISYLTHLLQLMSAVLGGSVTVGETKPTVSSVSPSTITNAQTSVTITGTNFAIGASVEAVGTNGNIIVADTVYLQIQQHLLQLYYCNRCNLFYKSREY